MWVRDGRARGTGVEGSQREKERMKQERDDDKDRGSDRKTRIQWTRGEVNGAWPEGSLGPTLGVTEGVVGLRSLVSHWPQRDSTENTQCACAV